MSVISEVPEHVLAELAPECFREAMGLPPTFPQRAADREARREALSLRTTPTIKAALVAAASQSGRSLTQEIEFRLEASFMGREIAKAAAEVAAETVVKVLMQHGLISTQKED